MTVGVAGVAGVPQRRQRHPAVAATGARTRPCSTPRTVSGADRIFAVGGVQALAAMAFGLLDGAPADMIVGAGNAYVAEAKRQLYGRVGIDVLAGPSEVAVIADDTADAEMVAADLLAQAEHGPTSPACLVTTSAAPGRARSRVEIERQLAGPRHPRRSPARPGATAARSTSPTRAKTAVEVMDLLAPEHLEVLADDLDFYLDNLHNYGSLFLGPWSTVAYADKGMSGHQPRAAHRPRRPLHRRAVGDRLPQAADLPARHPRRATAGPGRAGGHDRRTSRGCPATATAPSSGWI